MNKFFSIKLTFLLILVTFSAKLGAQSNCSVIDCSATSPAILPNCNTGNTISSGTLNNPQAGQTYCITGTVTINGDIPTGTIIYISASGTVNTQNINNFRGQIINQGTFNQGNSNMGGGTGRIDNYNILNFGQNGFNAANNDIIVNYKNGRINMPGNFLLDSGSSLTNCGTINQTNSGASVNIKQSTCLINREGAKIETKGNLTIENGGSFDNYGLAKSEKDFNINSNSFVYNECSFWAFTRIVISQSFINNGLLLVDDPNNNFPGAGQEMLIINGGATLTNNRTVAGGEFQNSGIVNGTNGDFHFLKTTNNNGTFSGTSVAKPLNFYDETNNNGKVFDTGNIPTNTTSDAFIRPTPEELSANCGLLELPFPVTFINFSVKEIKSGIEIYWSTAQENNNDYFQIEFSTDGVVFQDLQRVKGQGNSSGLTTYKYLHESVERLNASVLYYRIKQVDFDGLFERTNVVSVAINRDHNKAFKLFPNPQRENDLVFITGENITQVEVYNSVGQIEFRADGLENLFQYELPTIDLAKGIHFVRINNQAVSRLVIE